VAEICTEAQVSKGAFYHHFPSKHDVFMSLLENWLKHLDRQLFTLTEPPKVFLIPSPGWAVCWGLSLNPPAGACPCSSNFGRRPAAISRSGRPPSPLPPLPTAIAQLLQRGVERRIIKNPPIRGRRLDISGYGDRGDPPGLLDPDAAEWDKVESVGLQVMLDGLRKNKCRIFHLHQP